MLIRNSNYRAICAVCGFEKSGELLSGESVNALWVHDLFFSGWALIFTNKGSHETDLICPTCMREHGVTVKEMKKRKAACK